jgi:hypothetical protein
MAQTCVEHGIADVADIRARYTGKPGGFVDVVGLAAVNAGAVLCARVEILALKGALSAADSAVVEAERFDVQYPMSAMSWGISGACLPRAKAFVREKRGDLRGARAAYEAILADATNASWAGSGVFDVVYGRLAMIALQSGDEAAAERWATKGVRSDATSNVVLAVLLQRKGDTTKAMEQIAYALKLMDDAAASKYWTLPIHLAEHRRAKAGL